ncbi:UNVERIFIED_CONTAM: hypothetical protein GTU68_061895 [Idotea baltica]|nr:hypothetical protein [Idotea baltica]
MVASQTGPARPGTNFFPLTVDYRERFAAAGKFAGGFLKREGRPTTREILTCRLTDRPIRPLFPKKFREEVQVMTNVMACDGINDPDVLNITGASASLMRSGMPFSGPIAAVRVGRVNDEFICMPNVTQMAESDLDLIVAGSVESVLMIEGFANQYPEDLMAEAIMFAHKNIVTLCNFQTEFIKKSGQNEYDYQPPAENPFVSEIAGELSRVKQAMQSTVKAERKEQAKAISDELVAKFFPEGAGEDKFPYTIRLISDITESNGSSSMASVCGATVALMDAGVPIAQPVAGISIGVITDGKKFTLLTDIMGDEDHFGDMDFKIAGTGRGVTGIQLDLKIDGISEEIIRATLEQAKGARKQLLRVMLEGINRPRKQVSEFAPKLTQTKINPEKIGLLIGPGGKTIRAIQEETGATIDVAEDGTVTVSAENGASADACLARIEALTEDIKVGRIYSGKVSSIKDFGAFIEIAPGKDGLCHISELSDGFVKSVADICKIGDVMEVKVIAVDDQNRVKLSRKAVLAEAGGGEDVDKSEDAPTEDA